MVSHRIPIKKCSRHTAPAIDTKIINYFIEFQCLVGLASISATLRNWSLLNASRISHFRKTYFCAHRPRWRVCWWICETDRRLHLLSVVTYPFSLVEEKLFILWSSAFKLHSVCIFSLHKRKKWNKTGFSRAAMMEQQRNFILISILFVFHFSSSEKRWTSILFDL